MNVGDRVRIERDETRYPPRGTWRQFCGRTGTVVEINNDTRRPHLTEYGVVFGTSLRRHTVTWFKAHEMSTLGAVRHAEPLSAVPGIGDPCGRTAA